MAVAKGTLVNAGAQTTITGLLQIDYDLNVLQFDLGDYPEVIAPVGFHRGSDQNGRTVPIPAVVPSLSQAVEQWMRSDRDATIYRYASPTIPTVNVSSALTARAYARITGAHYDTVSGRAIAAISTVGFGSLHRFISLGGGTESMLPIDAAAIAALSDYTLGTPSHIRYDGGPYNPTTHGPIHWSPMPDEDHFSAHWWFRNGATALARMFGPAADRRAINVPSSNDPSWSLGADGFRRVLKVAPSTTRRIGVLFGDLPAGAYVARAQTSTTSATPPTMNVSVACSRFWDADGNQLTLTASGAPFAMTHAETLGPDGGGFYSHRFFLYVPAFTLQANAAARYTDVWREVPNTATFTVSSGTSVSGQVSLLTLKHPPCSVVGYHAQFGGDLVPCLLAKP